MVPTTVTNASEGMKYRFGRHSRQVRLQFTLIPDNHGSIIILDYSHRILADFCLVQENNMNYLCMIPWETVGNVKRSSVFGHVS
jgi:hypothetical protein